MNDGSKGAAGTAHAAPATPGTVANPEPGSVATRSVSNPARPASSLLSVRVDHADALALLASLPAASVDVCVTDPTYGETSCTWDVRVPGWPAAVRRVLKPHGSLWAFGSLRAFMETASDFAGWRLAQDLVWEKHNGSNNAADRFKRVHELLAHFYPVDVEWAAIYKEPQFTTDAQRRQVRRKKRPAHWGDIGQGHYVSEDGGPRHMRSVLYARSMHGRAEHETQKPEAVIEPVVRYSCPPGGVVLDPFCGAGPVGVVAVRNGRSFIGCDNRAECVEITRRRIATEADPLFTRGVA
jgi:site-specific DNA-methyltransferase (adenine-specific)